MKTALKIDCRREAVRIAAFIRGQVSTKKREGVAIGLSGGVDSAVTAELCVRAVGKEGVSAMILPDKESSPDSSRLALRHAAKMGIQAEVIDITPALEGLRGYETRDRAVKDVIPEYIPGQKMKISLPPRLLGGEGFNVYTLSVRDEHGVVRTKKLRKEPLRTILASTNQKQRTRMLELYFLAERGNLLVCGTTNRTEYELGFFVKHGDGGVDLEPIAHLYKTQVYELAHHLGIDREIIARIPTPDTFSDEVSDEDFYFRIPYDILDVLLDAWEKQRSPAQAGAALGLAEEQVRRAFRDFEIKHQISRQLREPPPRLDPLGP